MNPAPHLHQEPDGFPVGMVVEFKAVSGFLFTARILASARYAEREQTEVFDSKGRLVEVRKASDTYGQKALVLDGPLEGNRAFLRLNQLRPISENSYE